MKLRSLFALLLIGILVLSGCTPAAPAPEAPASPTSFEQVDPNDYVSLGNYDQFTEADIQYGLTVSLQAAMAKAGYGETAKTTLKSGTVQIGDTLNIDYKGLLNGEPFAGGTATDSSLTIGSGQFIAGFEEGLVGQKIGATVELPLTFPAGYQSADLAGKDVTFEVKINSVTQRVTYPKLTDEIAKKINPSVSTAEELKELYSRELYWAMAMDQVTFLQEIPDTLKEIFRKEYADSLEARFKAQGHANLQAALTASGISMDTFKNNYQNPYAEARSKVIMVAYAIAKAKGYKVTEEIFNAKAAEYAKINQFASADQLIETAGKEFIYNNITLEYAVNAVANSAKEN